MLHENGKPVEKRFFDRTDFKKTTIRKDNFELLKDDIRAAAQAKLEKIKNEQRNVRRTIIQIENDMVKSCMETSDVVINPEQVIDRLHEANMQMRLLKIQELEAIELVNRY